MNDDDAARANAIETLETLIECIDSGQLHGLVLGAENEHGVMEFFTTYGSRDTMAMAALVNHWAINRVFAPAPLGSLQ